LFTSSLNKRTALLGASWKKCQLFGHLFPQQEDCSAECILAGVSAIWSPLLLTRGLSAECIMEEVSAIWSPLLLTRGLSAECILEEVSAIWSPLLLTRGLSAECIMEEVSAIWSPLLLTRGLSAECVLAGVSAIFSPLPTTIMACIFSYPRQAESPVFLLRFPCSLEPPFPWRRVK